jgi:hypothetical protein
MKFLSLAATAALALALAAPASAAILVSSADDSTGNAPFFGEHFTPTGGAWLAQLAAGVDVGTYSLLSQDFTLAQASTVSGDAAFLAFDEVTYDDDAFVKIVKSTGEEFLFTRDILAVGDLGHTDWVHFTSSVLGAGSYTLVAGVRNSPNDPDNSYPSQLLVDSFSANAVDTGPAGVPEPASWALMVVGFGGLGAVLRGRRSGASQAA